jgi:hypothetical protein
VRLQIAVDDPFVVGSRHGCGHGQHDVRGLLERQPPTPFDEARQVFAVEKLHHQERLAGFGADVRHVDRVRVPHPRRQLGLAQETGARVKIRR